MTMGIYIISNTQNGMVYVGSSTDVDRRWEQHRQELNSGRHQNRQLQRDWRHYGYRAFNFTLVEPVDDLRELSQTEQRWIDHYLATVGLPFLYNLELTVPTRVDLDPTLTSSAPRSPGSPHQRINRQGLILGVIFGFAAILPISISVSRMLAGGPGWLTAPYGIVYVLTWVGAGYALRDWYIRHSLGGREVACPICSTRFSALDSFCPECGQPRTRLRRQLEYAAGNSKRSYVALLEQERKKTSQPPLANRLAGRLPSRLRELLELTLESGPAKIRLHQSIAWLQERPGPAYLLIYLVWVGGILLLTGGFWLLLEMGVIS